MITTCNCGWQFSTPMGSSSHAREAAEECVEHDKRHPWCHARPHLSAWMDPDYVGQNPNSSGDWADQLYAEAETNLHASEIEPETGDRFNLVQCLSGMSAQALQQVVLQIASGRSIMQALGDIVPDSLVKT